MKRRGFYFLFFIAVAAAFILTDLDFNNPGFETNKDEYLLLIIVLALGFIYLSRRNR